MFEFDPVKSAKNKIKHGIDFGEAQALWSGGTAVTPAKFVGEPRWAVIGLIGPQHWTAIITWRRQNIRIISVRRSQANEIQRYEDAKK